MRWTTGLFEWAERVQSYDEFGWNYMSELKKFVDGDVSGDAFIASVNRIFSLGCHAVGCSSREVRLSDERKANFNLIVNEVFDIPLLKANKPTLRPTRAPTRLPSVGPTFQPNEILPANPINPPSSASEPSKNQQGPPETTPTNEQPVLSPPMQSPPMQTPSTQPLTVPSPEAPPSPTPQEPVITVPSDPEQFPNQQPIETIPYFPAPGSPMQASDATTRQPTFSPTYNASLIAVDSNCSRRGTIGCRTKALVCSASIVFWIIYATI